MRLIKKLFTGYIFFKHVSHACCRKKGHSKMTRGVIKFVMKNVGVDCTNSCSNLRDRFILS